MKNKVMKKYIFFIILIVSQVSCSLHYKSGYSAIPDVKINVKPIEAEVVFDQSKTLQGQSETKVVLGIFRTSDNVFSDAFGSGIGEMEKKAATYKALQNTDFDILVNPKYTVSLERKLFVKKVTATVVGYGGKIIVKGGSNFTNENTTKNKVVKSGTTTNYNKQYSGKEESSSNRASISNDNSISYNKNKLFKGDEVIVYSKAVKYRGIVVAANSSSVKLEKIDKYSTSLNKWISLFKDNPEKTFIFLKKDVIFYKPMNK